MDTDFDTSLAACHIELAAYLGGLAILANECIDESAGFRMLGLPTERRSGRLLDHVDASRTQLGQLLPVWFSYGHQGVLPAGYSTRSLGVDDGPMERLSDLLNLLRSDDPYFELCLDAAAGADAPKGHLQLLVDKVHARAALDEGQSLTVSDIAALAAMNERSVKNATSAEGLGRLLVSADGFVSNEEAHRWLAGRRNYKPTERRRLPADWKTLPDSLDATEIPRFIELRLERLAPTWGNLKRFQHGVAPEWAYEAAERAGLTTERVMAAASLPLDIRPSECQGLARMLEVDQIWFTHQVMSALFPEQVDMLLNPDNWRTTPTALVPADEGEASFTVELSAAMLKHGYIDFPAAAKSLFPADVFGSRKEGNTGAEVELIYGDHRETSDIRIKSEKTISPRKRFTGWLNRELGAKPGDRIRLTRTGERVYTLTHLPR